MLHKALPPSSKALHSSELKLGPWSWANCDACGPCRVPPSWEWFHLTLVHVPHNIPLTSRLDYCSMFPLGRQRRLMCCLQLVADSSHTTGGRAREMSQRDPDFWDLCEFFWVFQEKMSLLILISALNLSISMITTFWRDRGHRNLKSFRKSV